jgi:3-hydroxyacyl-CoA dehydrogenase
MSNFNRDIKKAAVIGAGAMGSGIAAQLANAGVDVYLLDIVPANSANGTDDRSIIAKNAIQRMLKAAPATDPLNAGFMIAENAHHITPGNIEDHLQEAVSEADWIVEVVIENLNVKRNLFARLETLKKPDAIVSSNTSTIPLRDLVEGRSDAFKQNFLITHFFNPPRFMHLLEIVAGEKTDPAVMAFMQEFGDVRLGKKVIICKDTPAFLANRIGIYFMFRAITETIEQNIKIDEVDAVLGSPIGFPKEGVFGLLDLVGIGIIPLVTDSLLKTLADDDPFRSFDHEKGLALIHSLLKDGRTGRNAPKGGFYRMHKNEDGTKQKQAVHLQSGDYYNVEKSKLKCVKAAKKHGPRAMFETDDALSEFAWVVVRDTLLYAARLIPEIADDIMDVDAALRGGYNAKWGPFEIIDQLGIEWFCNKVLSDGLELPPVLNLAKNRPFYKEQNGTLCRLCFDFQKNQADYQEITPKPGVLKLADIQRKSQPLLSHYSACLWDIGDGVACLEFRSKMNTLDPSVLWVINQSIQLIASPQSAYKALVIYNEAEHFSLGANLGLIQAGFVAAESKVAKTLSLSGFIEQRIYGLTEALIYQGQRVFKALRAAPFPVIGAPHGMALGGGCEILLHCDALQASAETYMGLVESSVGLIPAWGGCVRYLERCQQDPAIKSGPIPPVRQAFQTILMPQFSVSTSAGDARQKLWLNPGDGITMNPDRLLMDAKTRALAMVEGYTSPAEAIYQLPGPSGKAALNMAIDDFYVKGDATYHDVVVADALADTLTGGGDTFAGIRKTETDMAHLERENFLSLLKTAQTRKRIAHTLKTGKPLRESTIENKQSLDEIRAIRKPSTLTRHSMDGTPLRGGNALKLRLMAELTAILLKKFAN